MRMRKTLGWVETVEEAEVGQGKSNEGWLRSGAQLVVLSSSEYLWS
jgi:hypothetical protein